MTTMTFNNTCFEKLHKSEAWMYTNVSALAKTEFAFATTFFDESIIREYDIAPANPLIVLINGKLHEEASRLCDGVTVNANHALQGSVASRGDSVIPSIECDTITIENAGKQTIHILQFVSGECPTAASGRVLIHASDNEEVSVAETHVCLGEETHLFMPLTEIVAGKEANVTLVRAIRGSKTAYQLGQLHVCQEDSSNVQTHTITLAGKCSRHEVFAYLDGEHIESNFDGMYMLGDNQHVDNHLRVEHNKPRCNSREFYKGILDGNAKSVFTGRIYVEEGAVETDAMQTNQNIVLSDDANAISRPQLEIYNDDVACTHGATTGEIDEEAKLYLRSRGIPADSAETLLMYAFLNESLEDLADDEFRRALTGELLSTMPGGDFIRTL
ncbi:MAG: Fe-S cluster assembly protein SufD [Phycisphaerae bacterium]|nr:Fe-S cluster assembly protein SufD [Phycisphaerae bacterium]